MISKNIFLYHLDYELQKLFKIHTYYREEEIYSTFKLITRLAYLLSTEGVIIPASNYFESDISFKIINELSELNEFGVIKLASSSSNLDELLDKKNIQHALKNENNQHHYGDFRNRDRATPLYLPASLVSRQRSASEDISTAWLGSIDSSSVWPDLYKAINVSIPIEKFENIIQSVPDLLGDSAFISEYILPLLPPKASNLPKADRILNLFITKHYIESFLTEYDAMCFSNIPIIDYNQVLPNSHNSSMYIPYNKYAQKLQTVIFEGMPLKDYINQSPVLNLVSLKYSQLWNDIVQEVENERLGGERIGSNTKSSYIIKPIEQRGAEMDRTLVITALQLELEQLLNNFNFHLHVEHEIKDSRHYYIVSPNSQTTIVCTSILGMGQVNAALALKDALDYMSFDRIILAGICGGLSNELNMGDIIVSEKIVDYELAKELDQDSIPRWNVYNSDYSIINRMKNFSSDRWLHQLDEDYPSGRSPKVFFGTVLSGNKVMASRKKSQNLASVWDKALAIEMEASGIASTLYQTPNSPPFIMVKSVCDLADKEKNDNWQLVAAKTAAVYVIDFVFSLSNSSNLSMEDKSFSQEKNILHILKNNYNLPELKELCFNIDIDFDDLPGPGKSEKAVELIKYCQRRDKMSDLVAQINLERNNILS